MLLAGKLLDPQPVSVHVPVGQVPDLPSHGQGQVGTYPTRTLHLKFLVSLLCPGMVLVSFIFSVGAVWQLSQTAGRVHQLVQFTWLAGLPFHMANGQLATFQADWGFLLDPLSAVMILVVTGVGFLIHVYSVGYMATTTATTGFSDISTCSSSSC